MNKYDALSRSDWLALADRFYARLRAELAGFAASDWDRVSPYLGWRNRDILAHMAGAISVNFRQMLDRAAVGDPSAPPEFYTFSRNAHEVDRRRTAAVADTLLEFWTGIDSILAVYRDMSDPDWLAPAWFFVGRVNVRTLFLAHLGDNVFHERDLLLASGRWQGLDPDLVGPLADWFLREVRPANFRPERAAGVRARVVFRLTGAGSGEWTLGIADGQCTVEVGADPRPDLTIQAETEALVVAAQARPSPRIGRLARLFQWVGGTTRREETVAWITGVAGALSSLLAGHVRVLGPLRLATRINQCFWQYWERTEQTRRSIAAEHPGQSMTSQVRHLAGRREETVDRSSARLGGISSILVGVSYLAIGVTFFLLPPEQQPGSLLPTDQIYASMAAHSTLLVTYYWAFVVAGVFAVAAVPAISDRVRAANPGWVRWTSTLALIGYAVLAVEYLVLQDQVPKLAAGYLQLDESAQSALAVIGPLNLNNDAWAGFGTVGLWMAVVNWLALRGGQWPKALAVIGLVVGLGNSLVIAGFILEDPLLILITAGLGGVILGPIWFVWLGIRLRRAAG